MVGRMDLPAAYVASTEGLLAALSLSHEMAHFWGGLLLYVAASLLPGARRVAAFPFLTVLAAELCNESVQAAFYGAWRPADTGADIVWTLLWPLALFMGTHYRRHVLIPAPRTSSLPTG